MEKSPESVAVIVLAGDGLNCERETGRAFEKAGAQVAIKNYFALNPSLLEAFDILAIPGGFSFGDEISSGRVLAIKLQKHFGDALVKFCLDKKPVIGICNGFQVLTELDLFDAPAPISLRSNSEGAFRNQWMRVSCPSPDASLWTQGAKHICLPVRNGEGRLCVLGGEKDSVLTTLRERAQVAFVYNSDWNGSLGQIAGITNKYGNVLGLMPHPEAALDWRLNPTRCGEQEAKENAEVAGLIFQNAVAHVQKERGLR